MARKFIAIRFNGEFKDKLVEKDIRHEIRMHRRRIDLLRNIELKNNYST